jgi:hypothetical protein
MFRTFLLLALFSVASARETRTAAEEATQNSAPATELAGCTGTAPPYTCTAPSCPIQCEFSHKASSATNPQHPEAGLGKARTATEDNLADMSVLTHATAKRRMVLTHTTSHADGAHGPSAKPSCTQLGATHSCRDNVHYDHSCKRDTYNAATNTETGTGRLSDSCTCTCTCQSTDKISCNVVSVAV